jgi:hypothetical protein
MLTTGGCDPGFANLGINWLNDKDETLMWRVNLKHWDGKEHTLTLPDIGPCVHEFCVEHKAYFNRIKDFVIEILPPKVNKNRKDTNHLVRDTMTAMTQTILILYPHITIHYAHPVTMKALTGTSGAGSHSESKKRTSKCGILPPDQMLLAVETFKKNGKLQVDPIDATVASMLLKHHRHKLLRSRYHTAGVVRKFHTVAMTSQVVYPPVKKALVKKKLKIM